MEVIAITLAALVCFCLANERRAAKQRKQIEKLADDIATLRANMLYKAERSADTVTALVDKMAQLEQLAKRRTRR